LRSLELSLDDYDTDKISNRNLKAYDPIFEPYVQKKIALLELGIKNGGSLLLWRDYFPFGTIAGIDIKLPSDFDSGERIQIFEGDQTDTQFLSQVADSVAPEGFDIIIDDASHIGELTKITFWHLFDNHLKQNGIYAIEDWETGYLDGWHDGKRVNPKSQQKFKQNRFRLSLSKVARDKLGLRFPMRSHSYGMVGFIKQLIDEQGAAHVTGGSLNAMLDEKSVRASKFESMLITAGIVFIKKA
jgi:hypothetical protein